MSGGINQQYLKEGVVLTTLRSDATCVLLKCDRGSCYRNRLPLQMKDVYVELALDSQGPHFRFRARLREVSGSRPLSLVLKATRLVKILQVTSWFDAQQQRNELKSSSWGP